MEPLSLDIVMAYPDLAEQPLLALYGADQNALQNNAGSISEAELYERLLFRFAHREIVKDGLDRSDEQLTEEIEVELERLSIVAFAMFNRGAQWIGEHELDRDLSALLGGMPDRHGTREPSGPGEAVLGRFFFIQRADATRDTKTLRTYEFLHATFSEYLVARLAWHVLRDLLGVSKIDFPFRGPERESAIDWVLRTHERGEEPGRFTVRSTFEAINLPTPAATRPELVKRARYAAQEQGWFDEVEWP